MDFMARDIRDNFPAGRTVYVESGDEPWNALIDSSVVYTTISRFVYPDQDYLLWYVDRTDQIKKRFVDRFNEGGRNRGGEIKNMINVNRWNAGGDMYQWSANGMIEQILTHALANNIVPDAVAFAPYQFFDSGLEFHKAYWTYDDDQVMDLWSHDQYYNTQGTGVWLMGNIKYVVDTFNAAHSAALGKSLYLYGYEGDFVGIYVSCNVNITQEFGAADQTLYVSTPDGWPDLSYFVVGTPLYIKPVTSQSIPAEWVFITGVGSKSLQVSRGQYGTTAVAHPAGTQVRTAYNERCHDLMYSPGMYWAQQDWFGLCQKLGFRDFNCFFFSGGLADRDAWFAAYHSQQQLPGRGDGSDGKNDNRLVVGMPRQDTYQGGECQPGKHLRLRAGPGVP